MKLLVGFFRCAVLVAVPLLLTGCPSGQGASDEEKEPHFLSGKNRVNAMDYARAAEAFEKALEINPRSAAAHFELGWIYERKETEDPAAAIYHYERFLKLRPRSEKGAFARDRIIACKRELAATVSMGPLNEQQRRNIEKLAEENKLLTEQNKQLADEVGKWRAYYAANPRGATNNPASVGTTATQLPVRSGSIQPGITGTTGGNATAISVSTQTQVQPQAQSGSNGTVAKTYVIKQGDTLASIARQYHVKLEALNSANPGLDARRLRPGQSINLP